MRLTSIFHRTSKDITHVKRPRHPLVSLIIWLYVFFLFPQVAFCNIQIPDIFEFHVFGIRVSIFSIAALIISILAIKTSIQANRINKAREENLKKRNETKKDN